MVSDLWRIDATHEGGGAFCLFRFHRDEAEAEAFRLRNVGCWKVAVRPEAIELHTDTAERLVGSIWPRIDTADLARQAGDNLTQARRQLDAIIERRTPRFTRPVRPGRSRR